VGQRIQFSSIEERRRPCTGSVMPPHGKQSRSRMHRLQAGHFAVEDHLDYIATNIRRFYDANVARGGRVLTPQSSPEALAATR